MAGDSATVGEKVLVGVLTICVATAVVGVFGLWASHQQLRAEFDAFASRGAGCTGEQCASLEARLTNLEREVRTLSEQYYRHVGWGQTWVEGSRDRDRQHDERIQAIENRLSRRWEVTP